MLLGRAAECAELDRMLESARAEHASVLVLRGEAGIGKTALLSYAAERAQGWRVLRVVGVESEMELPFSGLHQLCAPLLDALVRLPSPQSDALATAFGLATGAPPDPFLVGLAVLGLLSDAAGVRPVLCLIDDAQWLDHVSRQILAFVARRLERERVAVLYATRNAAQQDDLAGLPELVVVGLSTGDARDLLLSAIGGQLDKQVADRIVAETRGNPLALLELSGLSTPSELAGGFGLPAAAALPAMIEESFRDRVERLPRETSQLLLLAAADPVGDPHLLWRAAVRLGIGRQAATPAVAEGLLTLGPDGDVTFHHPLVRSAVYRTASLEARQRVHRALAEAMDLEVDTDRRAWHRAHAAAGVDEPVATELERAAGRAQARGGLAAAAAFLEESARLTPEPVRRAQRALAAAQAKYQAGGLDAARRLLATVDVGPLDQLLRARFDLLRAQIAFASSRGNAAPGLLLVAAGRLETLDPVLARDTYLESLSASMFAGRLTTGIGLPEVAQAALAARQTAISANDGVPSEPPPAPPSSQPMGASDLLLEGLALLVTAGYATAVPVLRRSLTAFRNDVLSSDEGLRWLWLACIAAANLWDDDSWHILAAQYLEIVRKAGALSELPLALNSHVYVDLFAGELAAAASRVQELETVTRAIGSQLAPYGALGVAAWRGRPSEAAELIRHTMQEVADRGEGIGVTVAQWASAVLHNGLGRVGEALTAARQATAYPLDFGSSNWALVELVEAGVRAGNASDAAEGLRRLSEMTSASGTDWALGIEARSRALLSQGEAAERLYREAIIRLGRTRVRAELARAHLLYGESLRRQRRRLDAREQLRTAHEMFAGMGFEAFADRAARELLATGEHARKRNVETLTQLTAQEAQIVRFAREGLSNSEIGGRLFVSPRTVEYHLHNVFTKLDISSRAELGSVFPGDTRE